MGSIWEATVLQLVLYEKYGLVVNLQYVVVTVHSVTREARLGTHRLSCPSSRHQASRISLDDP